MTPLHLAVITTTRADWGLLSPIARELSRRGVKISVIAANMHFIKDLGDTYREIEADGFAIAWRINPASSAALTAAATLAGTAEAIESLRPDGAIILGDRYEALAAAQGCVLSRCPIVHIAGGAISEGAFDDSFRHAITKLSHLHLVETEEYRRRVIQLGEEPQHVVTTGAIGLHNILSTPPLSLAELEASLSFQLGDNCLLVTMHPATLSPLPPERQLKALLDALDSDAADCNLIITYPNNDSDPEPLIAMIKEFAAGQPQRVLAIPSLGMRRYVSALRLVKAVVGNSSSGIVEAPSAGIPTLDIGIRQKGRTAAPSVVHVGDSSRDIAKGLRRVLSPEMRKLAAKRENPYYRPDTLSVICDTIEAFPFRVAAAKHFHDL